MSSKIKTTLAIIIGGISIFELLFILLIRYMAVLYGGPEYIINSPFLYIFLIGLLGWLDFKLARWMRNALQAEEDQEAAENAEEFKDDINDGDSF